jgi:4-amino-4-deoxy-L-arabinose transferase-like glycosyltransferase
MAESQAFWAQREQQPLRTRHTWALGAALVALALALRLYRLGAESLWYDEAYSVWSSAMDIASPVTLWQWRIEFPLYYWLLHWWMRAFGQSELAVRSLSAVAGALTVLPMLGLGRRLFGERAGWTAALLLAVNPYHILYSQEARMYGLAVLFALASMLAFWRLIAGGGWRWWLAHSLLTGLTFHLHYYVGWLVLAENLFVVAWLWRSARLPKGMLPKGKLPAGMLWRWALDQGLVILIAVPAFAVFLTKAVGLNQWGWLADRYGRPGWHELVGLFSTFTVGPYYRGDGFWRWAAMALFASAALAGAWACSRGGMRQRTAWAWAAWSLVLPVVAVLALGQFRPVWVPRYLLLFLPSLLLLASAGVGAAPGWATIPLAGLLVAASGIGLLGVYGGGYKEDWRGVAGYLAPRVGSEQTVVLMDEEYRVPWDYYYRGSGQRLEVSRFADDAALDAVVGRIDASPADCVWLVASHADASGLMARLAALPGWALQPSPTFVGIALRAYCRGEE